MTLFASFFVGWPVSPTLRGLIAPGTRGSARGAAVCVALMAVAACQTAPGPEWAETDRLRQVEAERLQALVDADADAIERLHAPDFELINPYGERSTRAEYLSQIRSGQLDYTVWESGEIAVRGRGDFAAIRYEDRAFEARFDGEIVSVGRLRHTNLYEKRDGQWQIVWSHASGGR